MANTSTNNFDIPKDGYVAFDATSIRQLIINRLNEQKVFTDQNYVGSNLASIIDIISYAFHTLIYYLNKTSTESMFSEAQLYENINRIVKLIDYSPIGFQTSTLSFTCSALNLTTGNLYTIPRYSYVLVNNIPYSFNEDITFLKSVAGTEVLTELSEQKLLYQGSYQEYPIQTAAGEENETILLDPGSTLIDHFNIDVFVKPLKTEVWEQFTKTPNLFLETGTAKKYEIRLNPNKRYEIKFGNDINGQKLQTGDQVAIYYLASQGSQGEIGPQALNGNSELIRYNTIQYNQILNDIFATQFRYLQSNEFINLVFSNSTNSTPVKEAETADQIRQTAPATYRSQYRLVTTRDFENYIQTNFTNLISDVRCINNWGYVSRYLKYFYDIGITDPSKTERALFNQIQFADACNFNNLYLLVVPRSTTQRFNYLLPAQKELINSSLQNIKMATVETVFVDPVYKAIDFGITNTPTDFLPEVDTNNCYLEIIKRTSSRRDNSSIINDVVNVIKNYFNRDNISLQQIVDLREITQSILNVDGVDTFFTRKQSDPLLKAEGLSVFIWNPIYPNNDKKTTTNNIALEVFEYPYFNNIETLSTKIKVTTVPTIFETTEY
jgi:hypothetical protein